MFSTVLQTFTQEGKQAERNLWDRAHGKGMVFKAYQYKYNHLKCHIICIRIATAICWGITKSYMSYMKCVVIYGFHMYVWHSLDWYMDGKRLQYYNCKGQT